MHFISLSGLVGRGLLVVCAGGALGLGADDSSLRSAMTHLRNGDAGSAERIATGILERPGPPDRTALWIRGNALERMGKYLMAVEDFANLAELEPSEPGILVALGGARFKAGDIDGSIDAYDSAAGLDESLEAHLWQRGISHYYAGRLDDCTAQFELHRTVNPQDVENSVWHFLCAAARDGLDSARRALIPVDRDGRVPMAEVLELFSGKGTADDVMRAAEDAGGSSAMFYARLYLGLYWEAAGDAELSNRHFDQAVGFEAPRSYMWQVARVHRELRRRGVAAP